jgi:hypothetical protein
MLCYTGFAGIRYVSTKMRVRGWISAVVFMTPQSRMSILSLMPVVLLRLEIFITSFVFLGLLFAFCAGLLVVVTLYYQKIILVFADSRTMVLLVRCPKGVERVF